MANKIDPAFEIPVDNTRIVLSSRGSASYDTASRELAQQQLTAREQLRKQRRAFADGFLVGFIACAVIVVALLAAYGKL